MDLKEAVNSAKEIIARIQAQRAVSSVEFGLVYQKLIGKQYIFTNCSQCMKDNVKELRQRINELETNGYCNNCPPKPIPKVEVILEEKEKCCDENIEFSDELIPKVKKTKKKNG